MRYALCAKAPNTMYATLIKRIFDIVACCLLFPFALPVCLCLLVISGIIHRSFHVLFFQTRIGLNQKPFKIIKLRSMSNKTDSEGRLLSDEKRVTPVGLFLRRTSLDELPQLLNVLKGDMSLIGPRPFTPYDCEEHITTPEQMAERHSVRPGITGLAQIHGRKTLPFADRIQYDLSYVKNISFLLDIKIMFRTFRVIFDRRTIQY